MVSYDYQYNLPISIISRFFAIQYSPNFPTIQYCVGYDYLCYNYHTCFACYLWYMYGYSCYTFVEWEEQLEHQLDEVSLIAANGHVDVTDYITLYY